MLTLQRFAFAFIMPLSLGVSAQAMTASQTVEVERVVAQADGSVQTILSAPEKVLPGDVMVYTVNYYNDKLDVSENFRLDMPVPSEITYIEGSARHTDANILYSIDNGKSFAPRETLTINLSSGGTRAASADDITHIRWMLNQDVRSGERGVIKFKGQLK